MYHWCSKFFFFFFVQSMNAAISVLFEFRRELIKFLLYRDSSRRRIIDQRLIESRKNLWKHGTERSKKERIWISFYFFLCCNFFSIEIRTEDHWSEVNWISGKNLNFILLFLLQFEDSGVPTIKRDPQHISIPSISSWLRSNQNRQPSRKGGGKQRRDEKRRESHAYREITGN